jgi:flagellar hook-associated protein 3 FlgL
MTMRISTRQAYEAGLERLQLRQLELTQQQERLTSGKRVARASDDPAAAARAERALASSSRQDASQRALDASRNTLTLAESTLGEVGELLQQVRETLISAGNGSYSDAERVGLAERLATLRSQLFAAANRGDGAGGFLFAGQGSAEPPFVDAPSGVSFRGAAGEALTALDDALPQSVDGQAAWLRAASGNGLFETRVVGATPDQAGAWIDGGRVTDPTAFFSATSPPAVADPATLDYRVTFAGAGAATTFTVTKDGAATALSGMPYASGQQVELDGMAFTVTGAPGAGDAFELRLSTPTQSVFASLDRAIAQLRTPQRSGSAIAQGVQSALAGIDGSMGALQTLRARVGEALNRADRIEGRIATDKVAAEEQRSKAEDLDMVAAIASFQNQQSGYQAALQAYATVQRLSLFDYVNR